MEADFDWDELWKPRFRACPCSLPNQSDDGWHYCVYDTLKGNFVTFTSTLEAAREAAERWEREITNARIGRI